MKVVVFIAYLANYGGIESFMIRMTHWLKENNFGVFILADKDREINAILRRELICVGADIKEISFRKRNENIKELQCFFDNKKVTCITFSYLEIILADQLFSQKKDNNIIFYDPHQFGLMMDYWTSKRILKPALRVVSKIVAKRLHYNHQIIYMDRLCKNRTIQELGLKNEYNDDVVFLPIEIKPFDEKKINGKCFDKKLNILSVCRMTFPFKGYVFGLIKTIERMLKSGYAIHLTLIGKGDGNKELEEYLDRCDKKTQDAITWIPGVPYEELSFYYDKADLYIGMGTTVIDAVNNGVPAFPIGSYTFECKGYDFFNKDPENLGGLYGENDIEGLIKKVINMNSDQYLELCKKDHESMRKVYDIEVSGKLFLSYENTKQHVFNRVEKAIIECLKKYIK